MVAGWINRHQPHTTSELLTVNVLATVQDADDHDTVIVHAEIDAALPVRESSQAGTYPITRRTRQAQLGNFVHLAHEIIDKTLGCYRVILCDRGVNGGQIGFSRFRNL
jgi:hypothetical protein